MKKIVFSILLLLSFNYGFSQITEGEEKLRRQVRDTLNEWKTGGVLSLNTAQNSFTNWASGGQNSIALSGLVSLCNTYKDTVQRWDNSFDIGYGILQQGKKNTWIKTDDKIDFTSKYGRNASRTWYYAAFLNFKTQLTPGYNYSNDSQKISDFLAPVYILTAIGMDYKPNDMISVFIAPITAKTTIVNSMYLANIGAFGVEAAQYDVDGTMVSAGKKMRNEFGAYLRFQFRKENLIKNVNLMNKIDLFSNYTHKPQNIDVSWETMIVMKINKYLSTTITTHLIYDDDIKIGIDKNKDGIFEKSGPRTQFKEVIGVGFTYKLGK